ncbi:DUF2790 domain-containing protein [Pseudomonas sp. R5(2019)]|uniref:DUF2790 domain-containing protein n=1 Tax=Pseudomonas sp. R5(2019) TaxID=2697566 RepID=UPI0014122E3B|nr:DUF2790 domain-containing protein [Pseudomonas sp. R5(2019)]NBA98634.1 DUF2790 domain-containing protein [Pseudomonas sp. R5(2019)]
MNTRLWLGSGVLVLSCVAPGVQAQNHVATYEYGMKLDIAKVVEMKAPDPMTCEVVQAQMTYLDSGGQLRTLNYLKLSDYCSREG